MRKIIFILIILLNFTILDSQNPEWVNVSNEVVYSFAEGEEYYYTGDKELLSINKSNGLFTELQIPYIGCRIYDLLYENRKLWVGITLNGLYKYTNNTWVNYNPYNTGLMKTEATSIISDSIGNIWFGKGSGLCKFNGNFFENIKLKDANTYMNHIENLVCDSENNIWFTQNNIQVFAMKDSLKLILDTNSQVLKGNRVETMALDNNNMLFIGTDMGLVKYDNDKWETLDSINLLLPSLVINKISFDRNNNMWVICDDKLIKIINSHIDTFDKEDNDSLYDIEDFVIDNSNNIYVVTRSGKDLFKFDNINWVSIDFHKYYQTGLLPFITHSVVDKENNLWLSTVNGGVICISDTTQKTFNPFSGRHEPSQYGAVYSISVAQNNNIWIGNNDGDVAIYDGDEWRVYFAKDLSLPSHHVSNIAKDSTGNIWVGTSIGASKYDGISWNRFELMEENESIYEISALAVDKMNNICLSNFNTLVIKNDSETREYELPNNIRSRIVDIDVYSKNNKCLATGLSQIELRQNDYNDHIIGSGIFKFVSDSLKPFDTLNSGLPTNRLTCFEIDKNDYKWIGTVGKGVVLFDDENWIKYNTENSGLINDTITTLFVDSYDNKWIGTKSGLCVYREGGVILNIESQANNIEQKIVLTCSPNPITNTTMINFVLYSPSEVNITIIDIVGQVIAKPLQKRFLYAGQHSIEFDASELPAGIYYCTLRAGGYTETVKMVVVR